MKAKKIRNQVMVPALCIATGFSNILPAYAAVEENDTSVFEETEEIISKEIEVSYTKSASYFVTIPKTISLGRDKQSQYVVKVEGDIPSDKQVYVSPIDGIAGTEEFDFYMKDTNAKNPKANVAATVTQSKFYWNFEDATNAYEETNNNIIAESLTSGTWKGTFNFEINMHKIEEADPYEIAPEYELNDWDYTLDEGNKTVTLNCYKGTNTDVIVYANYPIGSDTYKTRIASYGENGTEAYQGYMFYGKRNIVPIKFSKNIDTSNVTNMSEMFHDCYSLTSLDISNFDTSNVTDMAWMFYGCGNLTDLNVSNFDTSKVTRMYCMFASCSSLTSIDVSSFDTSNVEDMSSMFSSCYALTNLDLSNFNTGKVANMSSMFRDSRSLTSLDLSNFDTSNVENMNQMFSCCESLSSLNLDGFSTSKVTTMWNLFYQCKNLVSLDLRSFNTGNVKNMSDMFRNSSKLQTIYVTNDEWSTSQAVSTNMFTNCGTQSVTYK